MSSGPRIFYQSWRGALRIWDWVSIYLPLILMGALAFGTYWLVRNSPALKAPDAPKVAKHVGLFHAQI